MRVKPHVEKKEMNRTFERLTFFILGALFVSVGYLLSGADTGAAPQENNIAEFDTILCKELIVHDGTPEEGRITLGFGEDGASDFSLSSPLKDGRNTAIYLSASETDVFLEMWGRTRESGIIALRCSDTGAILQTSTLHREENIEEDITEEIEEDRSGVIIETTPERSSLTIEKQPVVSSERL